MSILNSPNSESTDGAARVLLSQACRLRRRQVTIGLIPNFSQAFLVSHSLLASECPEKSAPEMVQT